jgi:hypothetical protein
MCRGMYVGKNFNQAAVILDKITGDMKIHSKYLWVVHAEYLHLGRGRFGIQDSIF